MSEFDNKLDRIEQRIRDLESGSKVTIKNAAEIKAAVVYKNKDKVFNYPVSYLLISNFSSLVNTFWSAEIIGAIRPS